MKHIAYPLAVGSMVTRVIEAGDGPAILFLHGLGARADRWTGTVERFGALGFRAIACDFYGHGFASKGGDGPSTVPEVADFVTAVLDKLEIDDAVLVGTSLGGHIVATIACNKPSRVRGLVLVGAVGVVPIPPEAAEGIRNGVKAVAKDQIVRKFSGLFVNQAFNTPALVEEEWRMNNSPGAVESLTAIGNYVATGIAAHYAAKKLTSLYTPDKLLLIWGEKDGAVSLDVGRECQQALGNPELVVIPETGHAPYYEKPEVFDPPVEAFVRKMFGK